jgi:hypothetical protein
VTAIAPIDTSVDETAAVPPSPPSGDRKLSPRPAPPARAVAAEVRVATREDEPEIIRLLHLMHAEGGLQPLDLDCARQMFDRAFDKQGAVIGVIGNTPIEAAIYLLITRNWYTRHHHIEECFCFVNPNYRRSMHAKVLIGFAKECSLKLDLPLFIGVLSSKRRAAKERLYRSQLGESSGSMFVFNSKPPGKPQIRVPARSARRQSVSNQEAPGAPAQP